MGLSVDGVNDGRMCKCDMIGWASIFYLSRYMVHCRSPMVFLLGGKVGCTKVLMARSGDDEESIR